MHKLKELLMKELKQYESETEVSEEFLDTVHKITDTIKNICKIETLADEEEGGYSERRGYSRDGEWMARGGYGRPYSYDDGGSSYRRRRDRMGRYSREGGYSERRDGGYSRDEGEGKEYMMECIEDMMQDAKSPKEKEALRKCMNELRNA